MTKIVVIGANHAGTSCINTILTSFPGNEVVVYDRNDNISFLGCGMALWIGEQISKSDGLFYSNKEILESKGAKVFMESEVTNIDFDNKKLTIKMKDGSIKEDNYDKLVLATGSMARHDNAPGKDLDGIMFAKLFQNAKEVIDRLQNDEIKTVAVAGSGYIGVELAEAFKRIGKEVVLISRSKQILRGYFDKEFSAPLEDILKENGIRLALGEEVQSYEGKDGKLERVITDKSCYEVDMLINAIGFVPNTFLGEGKLDKFKNGAYLVNKKFETNVPDVYAIGDCATEFNNATGETDYIALATNAVRSGIVAANNVCGVSLESAGVQGSSAMSIYQYNLICTGLSVESAAAHGIEVGYTDFEDVQKAAFMECNNPSAKVRIVYRKDNRKIVGAQLSSFYDVSMGIHMFSLAIQEGVTIDKLALTDLFFMPHFNQPYNYITMAALSAK